MGASQYGRLAEPKLRSSVSGSANRLRPTADFGGQEATPDIRHAKVLSAEALAKADGAPFRIKIRTPMLLK
jgi:hypothetical protein